MGLSASQTTASFFSSPEPKVQVSYSDRLLSVVCPLTLHIFDFFSRTAGPNSTKLGTHHPWVKGLQFCSNEGPGPHQRGDNHENAKIGWCHLKIFFSRTTEPGKMKLMGEHHQVVQIQLCSNHDPRGQGGATMADQSFTQKYIGKFFKNLLLKNDKAIIHHIYMEACSEGWKINVCSLELEK